MKIQKNGLGFQEPSGNGKAIREERLRDYSSFKHILTHP